MLAMYVSLHRSADLTSIIILEQILKVGHITANSISFPTFCQLEVSFFKYTQAYMYHMLRTILLSSLYTTCSVNVGVDPAVQIRVYSLVPKSYW